MPLCDVLLKLRNNHFYFSPKVQILDRLAAQCIFYNQFYVYHGLTENGITIQIVFGSCCLGHFLEDKKGLSSHFIVSFANNLLDLTKGLEQVEKGILHVQVDEVVPLGFIFQLMFRMQRVSLGGQSLSCSSYIISYIIITNWCI